MEQEGANSQEYHPDALALNTGRACFKVILNKLKPTKVYLPYYSCDSLLAPLRSSGIEYAFYPINDTFGIGTDISLGEHEYLLFINYFGLNEGRIQELIGAHGDKLILDNTHAFFRRAYPANYSFNSARKWFGVPDGAYLYSPAPLSQKYDENTAIQTDHLQNRKLGLQELAFEQYQEYERKETI